MPNSHRPKLRSILLIDSRGFDEDAHDLTVLVVVLDVATVRLGETSERILAKDATRVPALLEEALVDIGDQRRKYFVLVVEVAVQAARR